MSVKPSSFCANVKAFILALPPERKYFSLASFAQNSFLILICSCYLFKSIFFHIVQLVYSDIPKTQIFLFFAALSKRCRRRPLMESQSFFFPCFMKTATPIWDLCTFSFFNAKPFARNNDEKICIFRRLCENVGT